MDQFCAKASDSYRRCICSSKLEIIKSKERALGQTADQLQDFKDLNIEVINKTGAEVKAMTTATEGEKSIKADKSNSAQQLAGISAVLNKTKSDSLSTQGKLDIAGDINAIWSTTNLAAGADLSNLTGEKLYNAVHAQCVEIARGVCETTATLNMVTSAYGMYIENDCSNLSNALSKKINSAHGAIRETEREMGAARLENYNAHNSTPIHDCIAQVRKDITSDSACGQDYVRCLDTTGLYLNRDTGEPIYSPSFYQLELSISLAGDVLTNPTNRLLVNELGRKKEFAARGLDTCRDLSDQVWDEFMRQAIAEIYQGQQARVRQVKNECIDVVNACYDEKSKSLKDFSNIKEQLLLGARLELSEQMCREKLEACSNLYGGGPSGMQELVELTTHITDQKIAKDCKTTLEEFAQDTCKTTASDVVHKYPYYCRVYAPGDQYYAMIESCNALSASIDIPGGVGGGGGTGGGGNSGGSEYYCPAFKKYTSCNEGYYMVNKDGDKLDPKIDSSDNNNIVDVQNECRKCDDGCCCPGSYSDNENKKAGELIDTQKTTCANAAGVPPQIAAASMYCPGDVSMDNCGDYAGSLYQKLVRYAMQACVRPSNNNVGILPTSVLADVNMVMDSIHAQMGAELAKECERLGGLWINLPCQDKKECDLYDKFYDETGANIKWGYCRNPTPTITTAITTTP
jgi:hypothetical protein